MPKNKSTRRLRAAPQNLGDLEKQSAARPASGIAAYSALLASDPSLQVYRSFNALASRNLVCMQSELFELEDHLIALDEANQKLDDARGEGALEARHAARSWTYALMDERQRERIETMRRITSLLAEYQDAIVRQRQVLACERPSKSVRSSLGAWIEQEMPFVGRDRDLFERHQRDMVALRTPPDEDSLTKFLAPYLGKLLRKRHRHDHSSTDGPVIGYYSEGITRHIISTISAILVAVLLIGAIVTLYKVKSDGVKLGLVAVFTVLFATGVGMLTEAKRPEVYASTAAYAAVLVVFISGNLQGDQSATS